MKIASVDVPRTAQTLFVADAAIILLASGVVFHFLTFFWPVSQISGIGLLLPHPINGFVLALFCSSIVLLSIFAMGLYQRRYLRGRAFWQSLIATCLLTLAMWLFLDNLVMGNQTAFAVFAYHHFLMFGVIAALRPVVCWYFMNHANKRRLALVGSQTMVDTIRQVADKVTPSDFEVVEHHYLDCAGQRDCLDGLLRDINRENDIDEVAVELHSSELAALGIGNTRPDYRLSSTMSLVESYARWTDIELAQSADLPDLPQSGYRFFWAKRLIESTLAAIGLILVLPVLLVTVIAIKLDDGGSLFYRQSRVGKNGRLFSVLKFRSMVENAEADGKAQWARKGDNRVTRVGSFLRKSRIDEIPQLLNVVNGDMALVGPRPERPEIVEQLKAAIPGYDKRHAVRPGLTGWAQISYPYGASIEDALWKTKFDMYYIRNWTILLDLAIIAQTVRVVLFAEGSR